MALWLGILTAGIGIASFFLWFHNTIYYVFLVSWSLSILLAFAGAVTAFVSKTPRRGIRRGLAGALLPLPVAGLIAASRMSDMDGRHPVVNNLRQVSVGLYTHDDHVKQLPAAAITDRKGMPLLSWRVSILPFIEHDQVFQKFKLDEPWDSAHNLRGAQGMPAPYWSHWATEHDQTYFQAFVGRGTAFEPRAMPLRLSRDFPDGQANTFLFVEAQTPAPWTKPEDLPYDRGQALQPLGRSWTVEGRLFKKQLIYSQHGFLAAFADGSARFIRSDVSEQVLRAAIERNDGNTPEWDSSSWDGRRDFWPGGR